jgi:3-oxoacyl-[acyl-carrier protein] reductase
MTSSSTRKTALVFGGSRGIGAAAALRLAQDGYAVALTYVSSPDKAEAVAARIRDAGGEAVALQADSADADAIAEAVAKTVELYGPLDVVVVNAGVLRIATIDAWTADDFDRMLDVNLRGVFLAIQAATARMRDGGRVITIGSNSAERPITPGGGVYAMTKAAVAALVKGAALDLAPRRITVNNIQPGPTRTDMTSDMTAKLEAMSPLRRIGQPDEIAGLVAWLAGPDSAYMTGASLTMDGGFIL